MRMFKWGVMLVFIALFVTCLHAASNPIITGRAQPGNGWILVASDDDIDGSAELITELDTTFVQMAAADNIYIISGNSADTTQTIFVSGINDANGKYVTESFVGIGTTYTDASTIKFRYVDQLWVDAECAGVITLSREDGVPTFINSIDIGSLKGDVGQHFNGTGTTYLRRWWATSETADTKLVELRWYPDDADCLDSGDGFMLLDKIYMASSIYRSEIHPLGDIQSGLRLPAGGWLAVFGTGGAANQEITVTIVGQDRRR